MSSEIGQTKTAQLAEYWPCKLAAWSAGAVGLLMVIGGTGHLVAVISLALAQDKPYDFRLVSLIATGGILIYPGLLSLGLSRWLGRGRDWAFAMCTFGTMALLIYLVLLLFLKAPPDSADPIAGVDPTPRYSTMIVGLYLGLLIAVWASLRRRRRRLAES